MDILTVVSKPPRPMQWQSMVLDANQRCLRIGDALVTTSPAEFGLIQLLLTRRNVPMSKAAILSALFGDDHQRHPGQVDVFVARLRRSLAAFGLAGAISTVAGRGYALLDEDHDEAWLSGGGPRCNDGMLAAA